MMGHRDKLKSATEWDALTGWRRFLRFRPGRRKAAKRAVNRRSRKMWRLEAHNE